MTDIITVRGYVATEVRLTVAQSGLPIASFRMCSTERRLDRETNTWVDGHTNWYSVSMFRRLATNAGASIRKGDRVLVTGRLRIRPWTNDDGRTGTSADIDADTAGHDLMWGTANFKRTSADRSEDTSGSSDTAAGTTDRAVTDGDVPGGLDPSTGELYDSVTHIDAEPEDATPEEVHDQAGSGEQDGGTAGKRGSRTRAARTDLPLLEDAGVPS